VHAAKVTIAAAAASDAAEIRALMVRAFAEEGRLSGTMDIPPLQESVADIERDIEAHTVLIACDGERIIGSARGRFTGASCEIRAVCVDPSHQGRGIGAALLEAVEQTHAEAVRFELTTNTLVPGNVAFYERRGYHVVDRTQYSETIVLAHLLKTVGAGDEQ
jgi:GNAT superfamily N-acetyltransferase